MLESIEKLIQELKKELNDYQILPKIMHLEYEARYLNKALLLRGTSFEEFQVGIGREPPKKQLAGTTLRQKEIESNYITGSIERTLEKAYADKKNTPYSISFNNSLFSGSLADYSACTYYFLTGLRTKNEQGTISNRASGYSIFIDKKAYFQHQCNNLFFIAPLAPLASTLEKGEYFHSRTKAAVALKKNEPISISGINSMGIKDTAGIILITRDPLRHAELFSNYLANNGKIIQLGNMDTLTPEEKRFTQNVMESQKEAAEFYKAIRVITPKIQRYIKQYKRRKQEQGSSSSTEQKEESTITTTSS